MYPHLYQKLKKAQMEEERCSEIERDNRTLVRRMTEIMQRSGIDTRNAVSYKSLNRDQRRRELVRITQENQALLKRIQQRQPTYNHLVWEQEREKNEALCERICRYPYRPAREQDMDDGMYDYYAGQDTTPKHPDPYIQQPGPASADAADDKDASQSQNLAVSQSQQSASMASASKSCMEDEEEEEDDEVSKGHYESDELAASKTSKSSRAESRAKSEKSEKSYKSEKSEKSMDSSRAESSRAESPSKSEDDDEDEDEDE